jgi:ParB family chromosome partitioning protein
MTLREILVSELACGEHNPRKDFDEESLSKLTATIRERGVLQPLRVRPRGNRYEIICGQRRWAAAVAAGLSAVPCVISEDASDLDVKIDSWIENWERENLSEKENADGLKAIHEHLNKSEERRLTQDELAARLGIGTRSLGRYFRLLKFPVDVQEKFTRNGRDGGNTLGLMDIDAVGKLQGDEDRQRQLANKIIDEDLSSPDADAVATAVRDNPDKADELLNTNLREEAEKSGHSVQTVVESIAKPIIVRKQERASVTEFGVITDVKSAALKMKQVLDRETFDDLIAGADDDALRMMRESLLYARESLGYALAAIDERLNISTGEIRMVK